MKNICLILVLVLSYCSCSEETSLIDSGTTGGAIAGSYANMLTIGEFLYVISDTDITTMNITIGGSPTEIDRQNLGFGIESIFHYDGILYIGSRDNLHIYEIAADGTPEFKSITAYNTQDWSICNSDPVIVNDTIAYVTLSESNLIVCGDRTGVNELRLYDINDISSPILINSLNMDNPKGLGLAGEWLFVCDDGLKVFNVQDPSSVKETYHFTGYETFDAIVLKDILIVVGPEELRQYDITDMTQMSLLSTIDI